MMKPFRNVDVKRPPKITFAIGLCISLPGRSPLRASGISVETDRIDGGKLSQSYFSGATITLVNVWSTT